MSAPSRAIFYLDGIRVNYCFINCGWFEDYVTTLEQIIEFVESDKFEFDAVVAYGRTFSSDLNYELTLQIESDKLRQEKMREKFNGVQKPQPVDINQVICDLVKRNRGKITNDIASEICGVQPMTGCSDAVKYLASIK